MTYLELKTWLESLNSEQLACNVTIYSCDMDEYFPMKLADIYIGDDVLDVDHPIIVC